MSVPDFKNGLAWSSEVRKLALVDAIGIAFTFSTSCGKV
jgi:hypothetical protein